jgi:hypothetical protein
VFTLFYDVCFTKCLAENVKKKADPPALQRGPAIVISEEFPQKKHKTPVYFTSITVLSVAEKSDQTTERGI